jgi:hypothetical protein
MSKNQHQAQENNSQKKKNKNADINLQQSALQSQKSVILPNELLSKKAVKNLLKLKKETIKMYQKLKL